MQPLEYHVLDQVVIHPFQAHGLVLHNLRDMVAGFIHRRIAKNYQRALASLRNQMQLRFQNRHTGSLGAYQGARNIETVFSEQLIEVISRYSSRDLRIFFSDQFGVLIPQFFQLLINFRLVTAAADNPS